MGRRATGQAGWRIVVIVALFWALIAAWPARAHGQAESPLTLTIVVTDGQGTPLAGAGFGLYPAITDDLGSLVIPSGAAPWTDPAYTDATGTAVFSDLAAGTTYGVAQLAIPPGHVADPAGDRFVTIDPLGYTSLEVVNPLAASATDGTVLVAVTDTGDATGLAGVTVQVQPVDPATGIAGNVIGSAVSDGSGNAWIELSAGQYVVSVVAPGEYGAVEGQVVEVTASADGSLDVDAVSFGLAQTGTEPTAAPTNIPAVTPEPTATQPAATDTPVAPTATTVPPTTTPVEAAPTQPAPTGTTPPAPTAEPSVEGSGSDGGDTGFVAGQPATITIDTLVCTSSEPERIGTMIINPGAAIQSIGADIPDNCRVAELDEFSYAFRDPRSESPWDDLTLGRRETDANGQAIFETTVARDGQPLYVVERLHPMAFSEPVALVPNGSVTMLAIQVIAEPQGDVIVRNADSVTGAPVAGACYTIAAAGLESVPLAEACDADDGADGIVTFDTVDDGDYVVAPSTTPERYVFAPSSPFTVGDEPVDLTLSIVPYGTLQLRVQRCATVPTGLLLPEPSPGLGDGIDGMNEAMAAADPATGVILSVFQVVDATTSSGDGAGGGSATRPADCDPVATTLEVVGPDGTVTSVAIDDSGVGVPLVLPPTEGEGSYILRDPASGTEVPVAIMPAGTVTATLVQLTSTTPAPPANDARPERTPAALGS
ncbi:MAG TPA: SpaA isopeptide-forming pilin-related protein [Thermomicrobiales bacterium]|jgi:hypothetical protein|nr:SpaA isopeptide-forming pilin-related protein [Thermomicrobiales bacterium]